MNTRQLEWYQEAIWHEVGLLEDDFIGNVDFKLNVRHGTIMNMNIVMSKSVKMPDIAQNTL